MFYLLQVVAGGTYDQTYGNSYYGKDAVTANGTNTNGGTSYKAGGGAGLTGNGGGSSSNGKANSILSGTPSSNTTNAIHYGGWGGRRCCL